MSSSPPSSTDPTTRDGLENILRGVRGAAREAGTLVLSGFRKRQLTVEHKGAVDLVTEFDRASEALLRERLTALFPSFAIVGEEEGSAAAPAADENDVRFYVDPIDGTTNFVHGHPFWCVSIGLAVRGSPILGVVLSPPLGTEWFGWIAADGTRRCVRRSVEKLAFAADDNAVTAPIIEEECRVSPTTTFVESLLATGFPYDRTTPSPDNNFDAFVAIKRKCQAIRRCGSAALDLCLVADGTYDGYWERRLRGWDVGAGIALVRAAGGLVTDFNGASPTDGQLSPTSASNIVATNGRIHADLLAALVGFHNRT